MSLGGGEDRKGPLERVGGKTAGSEFENLQNLIGKEEALSKKAEKENKPLDQQTLQQIPRLIQKALAKIEASQVYQTFKLPGTDYIVHDRREAQPSPKEKEKGEKISEESKMTLEDLLVQKGKLTPAKEKEFENYFSDPSKKIKVPEQKAAEERLLKLFTRFEKILLKRFEEGAKITQEAEGGRFSFLKKTADQWRAFFGHFLKRTVRRQTPLNQISGWVYRGLIQKEAKATVISDLALTNGQIEKFVRFRLSQAAQNLADRLAKLEPGVRLSREDLMEQAAEELEYLAIKQAEAELNWAEAPTRGKFLGTAQAEEKVANELGLQLGAQLSEKERVLRNLGRRKKGFGSGLFGEEEAPPEPETQFVPWYSSFLPKRKGPTRWFVILIYVAILTALVIGFSSNFLTP